MEGWNIHWRASEASETLSGGYKLELVRYIYLLRTPPRCFVDINVFKLGSYNTLLDGVIGSPQARTPLLGFELVGRGSNWRVSEVRETLLVVVQWKTRYLYRCIYEIHDTHFSSAVLWLRIVGEINCKPFLKDWKRALKKLSMEVSASSFLKLSLLLLRKKAYVLPNMVQYKFSLFYKNIKCE